MNQKKYKVYYHKNLINQKYYIGLTSYFNVNINGAPIGIRTPNLLVRSQTLYPVELWAQKFKYIYSIY